MGFWKDWHPLAASAAKDATTTIVLPKNRLLGVFIEIPWWLC
jgi:hypothetical protein